MSTHIIWHGHANFEIRVDDYTLYIDPFFTGNPTATMAVTDVRKADLVLVTHVHGDHVGDAVTICRNTGAMLGAVVGAAGHIAQDALPEAQILNGHGFNIGGSVTAGPVTVTMTQAFHTTEAGAPVGYIITLPDGRGIYHAGDTGIFDSMALWGKLYSIDLALLPAGGTYTMDMRQAAVAAGLLQAKAVVPMHWGTFPVLEKTADALPSLLALYAPSCTGILMKPGEQITL